MTTTLRGTMLCLGLIALSLPATGRAADCLGPASAAFRAKRFDAVIEAIEAVRTSSDCQPLRLDLAMLRALALYRIAEGRGGAAWCEARDAYAPLRGVDDPDYARTAIESFHRAQRGCDGEPVPPARERPTPEVPTARPATEAGGLDPHWLIGGGAGGLAVGGVLLAFGIVDALDAREMADAMSEESLSAPSRAAAQLRAEGRSIGLFIGGAAAMTLGAAALIGGVWAAGEPPSAGSIRLDAGPAGVRLSGAF